MLFRACMSFVRLPSHALRLPNTIQFRIPSKPLFVRFYNAPQKGRLPINEEIPFRYVHLRDNKGKLGELVPLKKLIENIREQGTVKKDMVVELITQDPPVVRIKTVVKDRLPQNEEIPFLYVHLRNEDGTLSESTPLKEILANINKGSGNGTKKSRITQAVELVSKEPPVVRIVDLAARYRQKKEAHKAALATRHNSQVKEHQMTWGVAPSDLEHKLKKAKKDMEKGHPVIIILAPKKDTPLPPPQEMNRLTDQIAEELKDVGREPRPREFNKGVMIMYFSKNPTK